MKSIKLLSLVSVLLAATLFGTNEAHAYNGIDPMVSANAPLPVCANETSMDCIESVSVIHAGKVAETAKLVDINGYSSQWSFHSQSLTGLPMTMGLYTALQTRTYIPEGWVHVAPALHVNGDPRAITGSDDLKVVVRMSWLRPQNVGLYAKNADFIATPISGGTKYTFSGTSFLAGHFNDVAKFNKDMVSGVETKADQDDPTLYFLIDDYSTIPNGSIYSDKCSDKGYTVEASNAVAAGMPYMSGPDTLSFNTYAAHRLSNGDLNEGFFFAQIHLAFLDCQWPNNTLSSAPALTIEIVDQDGTKQIATSTVKVEKGILILRAAGFHYSAPTITVKRSEVVPTPEPSASPTPTPDPTPTPSPSETPVAIADPIGAVGTPSGMLNPVLPPIMIDPTKTKSVNVKVTGNLVLTVKNPGNWKAKIAKAGIVKFVPGGNKGTYVANPGFKPLKVGTTTVVLTDGKKSYNLKITVTK